VSVLERKLGRDLRRLAGQVATIALVLTCGIMAMVMMRGTFASLLDARDAYYASGRFAEVFARLQRAPEAIVARVEAIDGVARAESRLVEDVMVPLADAPEPIAGRLVSIPDDGEPRLNALRLTAGRLPDAAAGDEIVILAQFAQARALGPGDRLPVVVHGELRTLAVVGVGITPEYIFAMSGREMIADPARFVVAWMPRRPMAELFRMEGGFDDLVLGLSPGASLTHVLAEVDHELEPYGGLHAYGRDKQLSAAALDNELDQLRTLALVIPAIFLAVAGFLVNVVVSRLVFLERTQIAVLKAVGFGDGRVALHYLALVALIGAIAIAAGTALGTWFGGWMTDLYARFFRLPGGEFALSPGLVLGTAAVTLGAAALGALASVRRVARMPPAQAMLPPAPLRYHRTLLERLGVVHLFGGAGRMAVREIGRRPLRFLLSAAGIAMGVAIFIFGRFSWDSFDRLMSQRFLREHREDLIVTLDRRLPERATRELGHLAGVERAEPMRAIGARLHAGHLWRDASLIGLPAGGELRQLLDGDEVPLELPAAGLLVTDELAHRLGARVGDELLVEVLEGEFPTRPMPIMGLVDEPFGLQAYARAEWLADLLGQEPGANAALLRVAPDQLDAVRRRLKDIPSVLGVVGTAATIDNYRGQTGESMSVMTIVLTLSAAAIAIGVVYNNARIALSLRGRDLATLRVLGFTRPEVSTMFLVELGLQVAIGIPFGLWLGRVWSAALLASFDLELMRLPLTIRGATYATAALIAIVSAIASGLLVRRRLDRLDLLAVLKASE
jgi:putative ABC transport system permease protein